jgi:hypothetical protein
MRASKKIQGGWTVGRRVTSDFLSLEEVGRLAGGDSRSNGSLSRLAVFNAWSRAVGPTLRMVTRPSRYAHGRLVVEVISAVWRRELERLRGEILGRLDVLLPAGSVSSVSYALRPGLPRAPEMTAGAALAPLETGPAPPDRIRGEASPRSNESEAGRDEELRRRLSEVARRYVRLPA